MEQQTLQLLKDLGTELRMSRTQTLGGAVLLVGGEASTIAFGEEASTIKRRPVLEALRRRVLLDFDSGLDEKKLDSLDINTQIDQFDRIWSKLGMGPRSAYWNVLQKELQPTTGLKHLAELLKERYFPVVLTTNVDQLIESIFIASMVVNNQALREWSVLVNGRDQPLAITEAIQNNSAQATTLIKLCGDFQSRQASLTQRGIKEKAAALEGMLAALFSWHLDLIVVGLTPIDDVIFESFPKKIKGKVTFIGRSSAFFSYFKNHDWPTSNYITDESLTFDATFEELARRLDVLRIYEQVTGKRPDNDVLKQVDQTMSDGQPESVVADMVRMEQEKEKQAKRDASSEGARAESSTTSKAKTNPPPVEADKHQAPLVELVDNVLEEETEEMPSIELIRNTIFTIRVDAERQVSFHLSGSILNYTSPEAKAWSINTANINIFMQDMGYEIATYHRMADARGFDRWRRQAKREGGRLYNDLIQEYPDLNGNLAIALKAAASDPANLTLVFEGPRHHLGVPYELLRERDAYLAIKHPLCRKVSGIQVRHTEMFDEFLRDLRKNKRALRVLLIASDIDGRLPKADQEIDELKAAIVKHGQRLSIRVDPEVIHSNKATVQEVKKHLEHCKFHIVHYAGHSGFDETAPENSGLHLWKRTFNGNREKVFISARELATWLAGSETRLFYLSSCTGAWTGNEQAFLTNDYLGLMDAIASQGIPYVLGFRWYVSDNTSKDFSRAFYDELFTRPHVPERAAWVARSALYAAYGERDETWASPILIAQNPYLAR